MTVDPLIVLRLGELSGLCQPPNPEHDNLSLPPSRFVSFKLNVTG
jgi:hypothetical protein